MRNKLEYKRDLIDDLEHEIEKKDDECEKLKNSLEMKETDLNKLEMLIIEQVEEKTPDNLARREQWWQNQLRVFVQNGFKNHCYRKEFT